ncbi:hypothetical protein B0T16DRAFT_391831 [Cercophora newfieldiana]|uniref:Uncharacterized protein n=1 Tax=Cercophora newfieldiana TaxID=92897 RepID=A0AA40CLF9_9PEZI|nr:hypothetical protein B0T16DRAFT_391831 [Cercophora newfieldiana]
MAPIPAQICTRTTLITSDVGRYVPAAELILVAGNLFQLLAYPFLPQRKISAQRDDGWTGFLQISSGVQLFFVHLPNFFVFFTQLISKLECAPSEEAGRGYVILPVWIIYLNLICLCEMGVRVQEGREEVLPKERTRDDFEQPAFYVIFLFFFEVLRALSAVFAHATSSWTIGILLAIVVGGFSFVTIGNAFIPPAHGAIQTCLYRFMTRNVEAWEWLPQNGATEDFEPVWATALGIPFSLRLRRERLRLQGTSQ